MNNSSFIQKTLEVKQQAHAPYSNFKVGALLITSKNKIYSGCNIENSSYSLSICAERVALFKAISNGEHKFKEIYIASDSAEYCPPCGACRQVLWEFAGNIRIVMINKEANHQSLMLEELLPMPFDKTFLGGE